MLTSEQVFDLLPTVSEIYTKIGIKGYRTKVAKDNKGKKDVDATGLGIDLFMYVLKNSQNIKEEIFQVVSTLEELSIEDAKLLEPAKMIGVLKSIFTDKAAVKLFKSAIQ